MRIKTFAMTHFDRETFERLVRDNKTDEDFKTAVESELKRQCLILRELELERFHAVRCIVSDELTIDNIRFVLDFYGLPEMYERDIELLIDQVKEYQKTDDYKDYRAELDADIKLLNNGE